jgi:anti-sigma regulatory factor (Ser/Thr protein kinase)
VKLSISSTPAHLPVVRAATDRLCRTLGFDDESVSHVVLSVDEALTNIIRHAYNGAEGRPIEIELSVLDPPGRGLRVRIRDYGPSVDPSRIKSRDLDDIRPGGLGVHIMNECMDHIDYQRAEGGGTILTMVKRLATAEEGGSP